jgi:hypothetical protein
LVLSDLPDAPLVDPKYSARATLALEVGLQLIPNAKMLAAVLTRDWRIRLYILRDT